MQVLVQPDFNIPITILPVVPGLWKAYKTQIREATNFHHLTKTIHLPLRPYQTTKLLYNIKNLIKIARAQPR